MGQSERGLSRQRRKPIRPPITSRKLNRKIMTTTISRLYNNYGDARAAVQQLEAAGVAHSDISIIASNADNWYNNGKDTFPDRDLDGKDDRVQAAGKGASI